MIISRTPLRISFTGGGTDFEDFYKRETGAVISTSIDRYIYITLNHYFEDKYILKYSKTEIVDKVENIEHRLIKECLKYTETQHPIEITSMADIPSGTGLGSSSAFTVGLLNVLVADQYGLEDKLLLADSACDVEIDLLKDPIGKQDQYASAVGGLNLIQFFPDDRVEVIPIKISPDFKKELQSELMLFYLGKTREAYEVLGEQKKNIDDKFNVLKEMRDLTYQSRIELESENIEGFCDMMNKNWNLKKSLASKISNLAIDYYHDVALTHGALAAKVCGAGAGGFMLLYAPKNHQQKIRNVIKLKELEFKFDNGGTKIVYRD